MVSIFIQTLWESLHRRVALAMLVVAAITAIMQFWIHFLVQNGKLWVVSGKNYFPAETYVTNHYRMMFVMTTGPWFLLAVFGVAPLLTSHLEKGWAELIFAKGIARWQVTTARLAGSLAVFVILLAAQANRAVLVLVVPVGRGVSTIPAVDGGHRVQLQRAAYGHAADFNHAGGEPGTGHRRRIPAACSFQCSLPSRAVLLRRDHLEVGAMAARLVLSPAAEKYGIDFHRHVAIWRQERMGRLVAGVVDGRFHGGGMRVELLAIPAQGAVAGGQAVRHFRVTDRGGGGRLLRGVGGKLLCLGGTPCPRRSSSAPTAPGTIPTARRYVGADVNLFKHIFGGAFGDGLFRKVKDGYTAISHVYEQDDAIYIFGFSRGAYTARSLAGMISACGLPTQNFDQQLVETAFQAYRQKDQRATLLAGLAQRYAMYQPKITCVGVWDTVGSLGIPVDPLGINTLEFGFLDTNLHPNVRNAFHAVSIDERRMEFPPTLWKPPFAPDQRVEQVWFAGVHCDVGGGYAETGLSDIALSWMLKHALSCDPANPLEIVDPKSPYLNVDAKHSLDTIHESWNPFWGFPKRRDVTNDACISDSVQVRIASDKSYRPPNLKIAGNQLDASYTIQPVVEQGNAAGSGH